VSIGITSWCTTIIFKLLRTLYSQNFGLLFSNAIKLQRHSFYIVCMSDGWFSFNVCILSIGFFLKFLVHFIFHICEWKKISAYHSLWSKKIHGIFLYSSTSTNLKCYVMKHGIKVTNRNTFTMRCTKNLNLFLLSAPQKIL